MEPLAKKVSVNTGNKQFSILPSKDVWASTSSGSTVRLLDGLGVAYPFLIFSSCRDL